MATYTQYKEPNSKNTKIGHFVRKSFKVLLAQSSHLRLHIGIFLVSYAHDLFRLFLEDRRFREKPAKKFLLGYKNF